MSTGRDEAEMDRGNGKERRAASGHRVIFEGLVAVGGQGAGFEAESVDVSPDGMRLRTAYLPMPGDFLLCRFDAGTGEIAVRGEVVWCNEEARGGEFGLAFVDLDDATAKALRALVGDEQGEEAEAEAAPVPAATRGNRVRLHIEGLGSPMKARVRDADPNAVHVGSALEFLKVGRTLELEDVDKGARREAWVDDVKVEVDPATSVPQLVVSLRFDAIGQASVARRDVTPAKVDAPVEPATTVTRSSRPPARSAAPRAAEVAPDGKDTETTRESRPARDPGETAPATRRAPVAAKAPVDDEAAEASDATDEDEVEAMRRGRLHDVGDKLKSGATAAMDKLGPAMSGLGERAKSLWGKAQENIQRRRETKEADKPRRVTAPPPAGALKAAGRRVVRSEDEDEAPEAAPPSRVPSRKRMGAIGAVVGLVALIGLWGAMRGGEEAAPLTAAELRAAEPAPTEALPPIPGAPAMAEVPLFGATPLSTTEQVVMPPAAVTGDAAAGDAPEGEEADEDDATPDAPAQRSWGQGEVKNAKVLRLKMDGPVAGLRGEEVDGGFRITIPGRKSTASASALSRKDKRIDEVDVVNKEDGAVVTVKFKGDEVPGFLAQVKGDRIEIAIAGEPKKGSEGSAKKVASKSKSKKKDAKKKK